MTKTMEEWDAMSPDDKKAHLKAEEKTVFGEGYRKDRKGVPQEQGIGSPGRETDNHFRAIRKYEGPEAEKAARETAAKKSKAA